MTFFVQIIATRGTLIIANLTIIEQRIIANEEIFHIIPNSKTGLVFPVVEFVLCENRSTPNYKAIRPNGFIDFNMR
jgi:hypothetical protein